MASAFGGIDGKRASVNSDYFRAGDYITYLKAFKQAPNRAGLVNIVWEMVVVAVLDASTAAAEPRGPHRVGDSVSWLLSPTKHDMALPNCKAALMTIIGVPEASITQEFCDQLSSAAQPMKGYFVQWSNRVIQSKNGNPFTVIKPVRKLSKVEVERMIPAQTLTDLQIDTSKAD